MIHSHNNNEHERIMNTAQELKLIQEELWLNHQNGNEALNRRIKLFGDKVMKLITQLENHVENTEPLDDVLRKYKIVISVGKWILGIAGTFVGAVLLKYFNIM